MSITLGVVDPLGGVTVEAAGTAYLLGLNHCCILLLFSILRMQYLVNTDVMYNQYYHVANIIIK
jgi:hypothetical protein